jgi:hypothetical protein
MAALTIEAAGANLQTRILVVFRGFFDLSSSALRLLSISFAKIRAPISAQT